MLKEDRWNGGIFWSSSVKMERKDRLYWRHPKTKSPDETYRPDIDWIIKAQYASQLATYFIERKHIQSKGLSPRKHITFRWNGCHSWGSCGILNCRFYRSSFLHLQTFCTSTCRCTWTPLAHCSCSCNPPTQPPPDKRTQKDPSVQQSHQQGGNWWCLSDTFHFSHWNEFSKLPS